MTKRKVVIGLDGGGTHTRALCCALNGEVLAYAQTGGSSPQHNAPEEAERRVRHLIADVLQQAERAPADVMALTAGMAGLDAPKDQEWAERFTALPGLAGTRAHVNDAVIAHAGALQSHPGIIVICGTGSILYAVNEAGQAENNYRYLHYADAPLALSPSTRCTACLRAKRRPPMLRLWRPLSRSGRCRICRNCGSASRHFTT